MLENCGNIFIMDPLDDGKGRKKVLEKIKEIPNESYVPKDAFGLSISRTPSPNVSNSNNGDTHPDLSSDVPPPSNGGTNAGVWVRSLLGVALVGSLVFQFLSKKRAFRPHPAKGYTSRT